MVDGKRRRGHELDENREGAGAESEGIHGSAGSSVCVYGDFFVVYAFRRVWMT